MSGRAPRCFTSVIGLVLAAVVGCQGPPPSIGHFNLIGFDEGGHHAASPATVAPCSTEERDLAFEDTVAYLHTDDDERVRPTAACCTPHANRWDFLLSPYPEHGHLCRVVRWERDGFIHVEHKYAECEAFRQRVVCVGIARR